MKRSLALLALVPTLALACSDNPTSPVPFVCFLPVAVPDSIDLAGVTEHQVEQLARVVNGLPGDRYGQDFRMNEEFRALWQWYITLSPEQRAQVLHYIRYQMALNGGPPYGWVGSDGTIRWTTSDGTSLLSGLR